MSEKKIPVSKILNTFLEETERLKQEAVSVGAWGSKKPQAPIKTLSPDAPTEKGLKAIEPTPVQKKKTSLPATAIAAAKKAQARRLNLARLQRKYGMAEEGETIPFTPEEIKRIAKVKPQGMELEVSSSKKIITFTDPVEEEREISFSKTSKGIHQDDNAGGEDYANVDELVKGFTPD